MHSKNIEAPFPIYQNTIVPNDIRTPQNQHCFSVPCLFVLISRHFKPSTETRTNKEKIKAEAAKKSN